MLSPGEAEAAIRTHTPQLRTELSALVALAGRVLREAITLTRDQPPYDRVTMDGVALASGAWRRGLREFRVTGVQAAGAAATTLPSDDSCIEVMTGAVLPIGCDCVIPVEKLELNAGIARLADGIEPSAWLNVHRRGLDGRADQCVLQPGIVLGPAEIAVIASAGLPQIQASSRPRITVISTGDELVEPGSPIQPWQIWRSNSYAVLAALAGWGFSGAMNDHLPDDLEILRDRLRQHLDRSDVLVLSGGVSMGRFDFVPQVMSELGVQVIFHHVAQRPGKPLWFGTRADGKAVYALPGNPVSTAVCLRRYVLPGLLAAMGATRPVIERTRLHSSRKTLPTLTTFVPVKIVTDDAGQSWAEPRPTQGSGDFLSLLNTDGFVELPAQQGELDRGSLVAFYRW